MAKELNKERVVIKLGTIVKDNVDSFVTARSNLRAVKSAEFYQRVVDEGLSAEEQVAFFQGWMREEKEKRVSDASFVKELKISIVELRKLSRSEKFYDKYRQSFDAYKSGRKNVNNHIEHLEQELETATDPDLRRSIETLLTKARTEKVTIDDNILNNKVSLALNDKRESTLLEALDRVKKAKNKAIAVGNDGLASALDLKTQALTSQLQTTRITDTVHDMEVDMLGKPFTPTGFLKSIQSAFNSASASNTPITINGQRYDNAKQYWQFQMNDYIEKDLFRLMSTDYKNKTDTSSLSLTPTLEAEVKRQFDEINELKLNPAIVPFMDRLDQLQINNSAYGVNQLGSKIVRDYNLGKMGETSSDNINNTIQKLTELNSLYGVDVAQNVKMVIDDVVTKKQAISEAQIQIYQDAIAAGATPEDAFTKARSGVAGTDIPAEQIISKSPIDITRGKVEALKAAGTDKPSPLDISGQKTDVKQPKVSAEPDVPELGEQIPYTELLSVLNEADIIRQGINVFLKPGVDAPYRKISNPDELKGLAKDLAKKNSKKDIEEQLIRPKGTNDIFAIN